MGEYASMEHWKYCYETSLDDFLEIDGGLEDIFYGFPATAAYMVCHMVYILRSFSSFLTFFLSLPFF
jgi:hypothetical protein